MPNYRHGKPSDASVIARFQIAMAWETEKMRLDPKTCEAGVCAVFDDSSKGHYVLVEEAGAVVGSLLIVSEWSDWRNGTVWWIHSVYVEPAFRGRKLFSGLYAHIKALLEKDPSIRGLRLYVDKSNAAAKAVYAKLGMSGHHYDLYEWMKQ